MPYWGDTQKVNASLKGATCTCEVVVGRLTQRGLAARKKLKRYCPLGRSSHQENGRFIKQRRGPAWLLKTLWSIWGRAGSSQRLRTEAGGMEEEGC